jgi:outer membrane lipopolysaccharide assembly protein LptE/RlpB
LNRAFHLILLGCLLLSNCGYHLRGKETNLAPEIHSVAIPIFANRTIETGIESIVTEGLVGKFVSSKRLPVTTQSSADALLTGTVASFTTYPVAVTTSNQFSTEYRATLTLELTFRDQKNGKVLFREVMSDWRNYPVVQDLNATEQFKKQAIRQISTLLAERVYELILGNF